MEGVNSPMLICEITCGFQAHVGGRGAVESLLDRLAFAVTFLKQAQIRRHIRIGGIFGGRLFQLLVGARVIAAQHVREPLIVEDLDGRADDANSLLIGAVGKIKAVQTVVGGRKPDPRFGLARMLLDGSPEGPFSQTVTVVAEVFLGELQIVVGIVAKKTGLGPGRDRLAARARFSRRYGNGSGGLGGFVVSGFAGNPVRAVRAFWRPKVVQLEPGIGLAGASEASAVFAASLVFGVHRSLSLVDEAQPPRPVRQAAMTINARVTRILIDALRTTTRPADSVAPKNCAGAPADRTAPDTQS